MDLDAYSAAHRDEWDRLARLSRRRLLDGAEADELIELYQSGATQLSVMRTSVGDSPHATRLSLALSRARLRFTRTPPNPLAQLLRFFVAQLPAALYRIRWTTLVAAAATVAIAAVYAVWVATDDQLFASLGPEAALRTFAEQEFVAYYSDNSEAAFAGQVWTNNAWIAAQAIMFGVTGFWVPYIIFQNAQSLGISAGIMDRFDRLDHFFLWISPHGQLELYAIFIACGAGLLLFWAWVAPRGRTRSRALAEDGRAFFTIVVGTALALLVSGVIEGFVTRQDWPWVIKIGIGTVALVAFLIYQWGLGRVAHRAGETGDLDEFEVGARQIVSA